MSKLSQQRRYANLSDEKIEEELNKINPNVKVTSFGIQSTVDQVSKSFNCTTIET